jgi:hypothetical protein
MPGTYTNYIIHYTRLNGSIGCLIGSSNSPEQAIELCEKDIAFYTSIGCTIELAQIVTFCAKGKELSSYAVISNGEIYRNL